MRTARPIGTSFEILLLALLLSIAPLGTAADLAPAKAPHNAYSKVARDDLLTPLARQGELRVIVGLQTPSEVSQLVDRDPDSAKELKVAQRQARVLQRLA